MSTTDMRASLTVTADASALVAEMRKGSEGLREIRRETEGAAKAAEVAASQQGRMAARMGQSFGNFGAAGTGKSAKESFSVFEGDREYQAFQREQADQAARAYRAIEESLNPLIRAERELAQAQDVVNRALAQGQTSQEAASRTLQQLQSRYDGFARAQSPAAQSARAFEAAIEAETAAMHNLTLALDPAARAQAEMAQLQDRTTRAVRMGIITQEEANRVMKLAETSMNAVGKSGFAMAGGLQNAGYQFTDIIVQLQGGQAMGLVLAQQLPQLIGGFGALGAVLGVVVALGAPLVTNWIMGADAANTLDKRLDKLTGTLGSVNDRLELLSDRALSETFGTMTDDIRDMTSALLALERASALKQLQSSLDKVLGANVDMGFWQKLNRPLWGEGKQDYTQLVTGWNYADLTKERGPSFEEFQSRRADIDQLAKAGEVEKVVSEVDSLISDFAQGGAITDLNTELLSMLKNLGNVALGIAETEANFNGSARAAAIKAQTDEMVRGYGQQADLSRTILKFGEDSAEVEAERARQARANLLLRLDEMKVARDSEDARRAMAALDADLAASAALTAQARDQERDALFGDLGRQAELSSTILNYGQDSAQVEALRAEHAREVNAERLKEMGLAPGLLAFAQQLFAAEQKRGQQIKDQEQARKAGTMLAGLREEAAVNRAIAIYGRDSLQVKELQIAAARQSYEESLKSLQVSAEEKRQLMAQWELTKGMNAADPFGQVAAAREMQRSQRERVAQLKLEQALLGQTEVARSRILAVWKAEMDMRQKGIDLTSVRAAELRQAAIEEDSLARSVERQKDAWSSVEQAAESALDSIFDKLIKGDWEDALSEMAQNLTSTLYELSIKNPAKNAVLGKDLPTMADVGGLSGIWERLTGRGDGSDVTLPEMPSDVGTMQVQAASVVIGGPGALSLLGAMPGSANSALPPGSFAGLGNRNAVQSQVWEFFAGKGLKPHQIAGIMGNVSQESAFNPLAEGDNGDAYGLFQHNDRKGKLFDFIGGQGNLGDVNRQLEFAWQELLTSESGPLSRLMASTDTRGATEAFLGFERPSGFSLGDPTGSHGYAQRVAAAEAALTKFGTATETATMDLGTLGSGMGVFGNALQGFAQGGTQGAMQGILGGVGSLIVGALKIPGFAMGGNFAGGLRIVGENGPELEYTGPSRIMNADLTRQLLNARAPVLAANANAAVDTRPVIQVINNSSAQISGEVEETTDARGQRQYMLAVSDVVGQGLAATGGRASKVMRQTYGAKRPGRIRP